MYVQRVTSTDTHSQMHTVYVQFPTWKTILDNVAYFVAKLHSTSQNYNLRMILYKTHIVYAHKNGIVQIQLWYKDDAGKKKIKNRGIKTSFMREGEKVMEGKTKEDYMLRPLEAEWRGTRWLSCQDFLMAVYYCLAALLFSFISFIPAKQTTCL